MRELRIAVIDDDYWKREHMAQELDSSPHIAVVHALDQDTAVAWSLAQWDEIDIAIVDVVDEMAPGEVGTDMFSGIQALERLKHIDVKTLAITPHRHHPIVELRIHQANVNWVYRRYEVNDLDRLVDVLLAPASDHQPVRPADDELERFGARVALPNNSVRAYERSEFHGLLTDDSGQKELKTTYRKLERFRHAVVRTGFKGTEYRVSGVGLAGPTCVRISCVRSAARTHSRLTRNPVALARGG
jgi:hypothetical protein